jgi:hypothetical protein
MDILLQRERGYWVAGLLAAVGILLLADDRLVAILGDALQQFLLPGYVKLLNGPFLCS